MSSKKDNLATLLLPDIQGAASTEIKGALVPIMRVGISEFRLPLTFRTKSNELLTLEATITGSVNLRADRKGIHMSRIMRSFYNYKEVIFTVDTLSDILETYKKDLDSEQAHLKISFNYPILQEFR